MERYMLHLVNDKYVPNDAKRLLGNARELCSKMDITVRDCRVSSRCIEFDISIDAKTIDDLIEHLSPIGSLDNAKLIIEEPIVKEDAIKLGVEYFNTERFWECHEVLEGVWKQCLGDERKLVQGIILVAAALVHHQKFEDDICSSIFGRALENLEKSDAQYHGIDVKTICTTISNMRKSEKIKPFLI